MDSVDREVFEQPVQIRALQLQGLGGGRMFGLGLGQRPQEYLTL